MSLYLANASRPLLWSHRPCTFNLSNPEELDDRRDFGTAWQKTDVEGLSILLQQFPSVMPDSTMREEEEPAWADHLFYLFMLILHVKFSTNED
jgi:hypothetical protein